MKIIIARLILLSTSIFIISLMLINASFAKIDLASVSGIWIFDEGKGDTAKDISQNGNDGKLNGNPKWVDGKLDKALEFSGSNYVVVGDNDTLNMGTGDLTITSWIKVGSVENVWDQEIAWKGARHWKKGYVLEIAGKQRAGDAGKAEFTLGTGVEGEDDTVLSQNSVADGNWHHIAGVIDRKGLMYIYVDGELSNSKSPAAFLNNFDLGNSSLFTIGRHNDSQDQYFIGIIDEVAIFKSVLTKDDIKNIMNNGLEKALNIIAVNPISKQASTWAKIKTQY